MEKKLQGKKVAILMTDGFEESEFTSPYEMLLDNGASVDIISLQPGKIKSWKNKNWGAEVVVNSSIENVSSSDYDALVLPGGVMNPDRLRTDKHVVAFVSDFLRDGKPIGAICHGPWTLIETGMLSGRTVTSYPSLKTDLINAGAHWFDEEVVADKGLVTSRRPVDLPAFCKKMVEEIGEGIHAS